MRAVTSDESWPSVTLAVNFNVELFVAIYADGGCAGFWYTLCKPYDTGDVDAVRHECPPLALHPFRPVTVEILLPASAFVLFIWSSSTVATTRKREISYIFIFLL